jgi:hypothetical protein
VTDKIWFDEAIELSEETLAALRRRAQARWAHLVCNPPLQIVNGPKRRRWDQYGAYQRRITKKWLKRNRHIHALGDAFATALQVPARDWWSLNLQKDTSSGGPIGPN